MTRSIDLYDLQEADSAIDAAEQRLAEIAVQMEGGEDLTSIEEQLVQFEADLGEAQREQREADDEVRDQREKIAGLEHKLYSGEVKIPRELKALQEDVQAHQRQLATMEERALLAIERREQIAQALTERRDERRTRIEEHERLMQSLQAEQEALHTQLEQLHGRRERQAGRVDRPDMVLYERLRRARAGRAVAKVERGTCQGCRITLPTTVFQRARSGLKIVQCTSCERILYVV